MGSAPWIMIAIGVLLVLLLIIFIIFRMKKNHKPDYYNFFVIGTAWTLIGIVFRENSFFFIMGLVFMAIGLAHKKDWKKNHRTWKQLSNQEKKLKVWLIWGLIILMIIGLVVLLLTKGG
tara:strand:- start:2697 stop:3053 length:357 start_codon:yes stop_codon:yes gene_type:complete